MSFANEILTYKICLISLATSSRHVGNVKQCFVKKRKMQCNSILYCVARLFGDKLLLYWSGYFLCEQRIGLQKCFCAKKKYKSSDR